MRIILAKFLPGLMVGLGLIFACWNGYAFAKGKLAVERPGQINEGKRLKQVHSGLGRPTQLDAGKLLAEKVEPVHEGKSALDRPKQVHQRNLSAEKPNQVQEAISRKKSLFFKGKKSVHLYKNVPDIGEKFGQILIPKLNEQYPVYEGATSEVLKKGAGHHPASVLPGEPSNSIISGHRDTIFRGLRKLKLHDDIVVTTDAGSFRYKIRKIRIVDADDKTVMTPRPKATLTVTTCYPFYYIGNAPQRYVLVADLVSAE